MEDKTGKLEKRLLLRQFITKALEIKRAETAELVDREESEKLSSIPFPGSIQKPPQTLTFYDVVQLARQQALVERTRGSSEDLIDLSDTPQLISQQTSVEKTPRSNEDLIELSVPFQPVINPEPLTSIRCDYDLLDASRTMAPQRIHPSLSSQNESGAPKLDQYVELASNQPAVGEMDAALPQEPSEVDLLGLVELPTSKADDIQGKQSNQPATLEMDANSSQQPPVMDLLELIELPASKASDNHGKEPSESFLSAEISKETNSKFYQFREEITGQERDTDEKVAALESVGPEASSTSSLVRQETNESCTLVASFDRPSVHGHQSSIALIDQEDNTDEAPIENSPTSTAAPSIFSHSSSLTSATGSSLPGITEEDVQARSSSSQTTLMSFSSIPKSSPLPGRRMGVTSTRSSTLERSTLENDSEPHRSPCISFTPTTHTDLKLTSKPQRTQSEDGVSLSSSLPQLSNIDEPDEQGFPWIVQAARDGNEQMIRKLLVSGADIEASHTSTRRHALSEASIQGHQRIVDLLIEEGCPLENRDAEGNNALHHACRRGRLNIAKSLVNSSDLIDAMGPQGQTPLHLAMQVPHQNVVMLLVQHGASVNARDASFRTPLHIGAIQGNTAMCKYLLNEGAQLDSREAQSKTPLQFACEAGHYELVQMMLNQSNLNPANMTFLTAFFAAVEHGHVRIVESFFPHGLKLQELKRDSYKPATLAAKSGCLAMVELMIQEDCDINARDENGWNALHFASYYGHYQLIERLIASDVSAKVTTSRKETPLLLAVKKGHFAVTERLLRSGKNNNHVNTEDQRGQQPVHHTVRAGLVEIFNLLMSNGAKINVENSFGWQPLHIATAYGHLALVERLLQEGANIEEKLGSSSIKKDQTHKIVEEGYRAEARWPYLGSRPLHLACEYGHDQIATYLISKGAKLEATCSEGWQPLHHATYFGSSALVEILLAGGVNPHATTNEGKTVQTLEFCTSGALISKEEKDRIRNLLREAMDKVRKQKGFKVALKRGSTVEEKNKLVRAATFSLDIVSKPQLHRTMTSAQASDPASTHLDMVSSSHRPRILHLPHTSPLPLTDSQSVLSSHHPPALHLPVPQAEAKSPASPVPTNLNLQNTDPSISSTSSGALTTNIATNQPSPPRDTDTSNPTPEPISPETQLSAQPKPKIKRSSTMGLSKVKAGIDISKLGLGSMGMPAFEIGKQTLEIGNKTLEMSKQGLEKSKQGLEKKSKQGLEAIQGFEIGNKTLEMSKQGLEKSKLGLEAIQGLEVGKQGLEISKQGYRKAKRFAKKGKIRTSGTRAKKSKSLDDGRKNSINGSKDGNQIIKDVAEKNDDDDNDDDDDDEDDEVGSNDAGSVFSLGEFADLGNKDS